MSSKSIREYLNIIEESTKVEVEDLVDAEPVDESLTLAAAGLAYAASYGFFGLLLYSTWQAMEQGFHPPKNKKLPKVGDIVVDKKTERKGKVIQISTSLDCCWIQWEDGSKSRREADGTLADYFG